MIRGIPNRMVSLSQVVLSIIYGGSATSGDGVGLGECQSIATMLPVGYTCLSLSIR